MKESLINSIESVVFSNNVNENSIKDSKKITEQYNWEKCSKKTFEVYKKIINQLINILNGNKKIIICNSYKS